MEAPLTAGQKAEMFAALPRPEPFLAEGYLVEVTDGPKLRGEALEVSVAVSLQGRPVPISSPLRFVNPPTAGHLPDLLQEIIAGTVLSVAGHRLGGGGT